MDKSEEEVRAERIMERKMTETGERQDRKEKENSRKR